MSRSRLIQAGVLVLVGSLTSACFHSSNSGDRGDVVFGVARNPNTSWSPKWDTKPDKSRKIKSVLSPTLAFADEAFRGSPAPQNETEKEQEQQNRKLFVESFRSERQCNGITLKLKDPKEADFVLQVFNGIEGRTGRWQYVLYRVDTAGEMEHGESTGGPKDIAKSICSSIRNEAFAQGGTVE